MKFKSKEVRGGTEKCCTCFLVYQGESCVGRGSSLNMYGQRVERKRRSHSADFPPSLNMGYLMKATFLNSKRLSRGDTIADVSMFMFRIISRMGNSGVMFKTANSARRLRVRFLGQWPSLWNLHVLLVSVWQTGEFKLFIGGYVSETGCCLSTWACGEALTGPA